MKTSLRLPSLLNRRSELCALLLLGNVALAAAQQARDRAVELTATPATSPTRIVLNWDPAPQPSSGIWVYRRAVGGTSWTQIAYPGVTATSYTDSTVSVGVRYEYRVFRQTTDNLIATAYGYAIAGITAPLVDQRGTVVLIIDSTQQAALASEIVRFKSDLVGDGWSVIEESAAPSDTPASVRAKLQTIYNADPAKVKAAILLGRIPVPYSGDMNPDGHTDHQGAWPADSYYAELNGTWTDTTVNRATASQSRNHNIPGDSKFDQNNLPSDAEIAIGRIDMANLSGFSAGANATELLRNYLRKNHEFRHRLGDFAAIPRRALIDDHFGYMVGSQPEAPAAVAWRNFTPMFGSSEITAADWFTTLQTQSYLWAYGCGGGSFTSASGIGTSTNFKTQTSRAVFTGLFGSYFGDWDSPSDPLLRSLLAGSSNSLSLVSLWANRPEWVLHGMALGESIGDAYLRTLNNPGSYNDNFNTGYFVHYSSQPRMVHTALLGDPTLRLHPVPAPGPASSPTRTPGASTDSIELAWSASSEPGLVGYHVYRAASNLGPYTRLTPNPVVTANYTDPSAPKTDLHYQVRAVVLTSSASGTYYNAGQALFLAVPVNPPASPSSFAASPASAFSVSLTWTPSPLAESQRIERSPSGEAGSWSLVADEIDGETTSFTDTGLAPETTYFYRLRASNPAGASAWSPTIFATTFPDAPLALILPTAQVGETSGSFVATVARASTSGSQIVLLSCSDPRLSVPPSVTIPSGQTSAAFTVTINDDLQLNPSNLVSITAFFPDATVGDSFAYTGSTALPGLSGGWGFTGAWIGNAYAPTVASGVTYTKNGTLGGTGTAAARFANGPDAGGAGTSSAYRDLATPISTGQVWISWIHNRVSSNWSTGMNLRTASGGSWLTIDYKGSTDNNWGLTQNLGIRTPLVTGDVRPAVHHFLVQLDFDADLIRVWMNPEVSGTSPTNSSGYAEVPMTDAANRSLGRFLPSGYSNANQTVFDQIDELRVAPTFAKLHSGFTIFNTVTLLDNEPSPTPLELWQADFFPLEELSDPQLEATRWGLSADPDVDGLTNLQEYAFGGDPLVSSTSELPTLDSTLVNDQEYLTLIIPKNPDASDLVFTVETGTDFLTWNSGALHTTTVSESGTELIVRANVPMTEEPRRFFRVRLQLDN